jgi:hypothetical protein
VASGATGLDRFAIDQHRLIGVSGTNEEDAIGGGGVVVGWVDHHEFGPGYGRPNQSHTPHRTQG